MRLKRRALDLLAVFTVLVLVGTAPVPAAGDPVVVQHDVDVLELPPGETARVGFVVTNKGDEELGLAFEFVPVDAPRHSTGSFSTVYALLPPGSSKDSTLKVTSAARRSDDPEVSSFVVRISWGRDLSLDEEMRADPDTVEGYWEREFPVTFDASPDLGPWPFVLVIGLLLMITAVIFYPAWYRRGDE